MSGAALSIQDVAIQDVAIQNPRSRSLSSCEARNRPVAHVMDHNERRLKDVNATLRLADTGLVLGFDMFGQETCRHHEAI